jgi:predicted NUDIX family NTP pyrophosphohydrolase
MHKRREGVLHVLLAHPGGPYWARKDLGAWSIPKGEFDAGENARAAAVREFEEELGVPAPGEPVPLAEIKQKGGKRVVAFALEGDLDVSEVRSNSCEIEWPPRSGRRISIPEIDRAEWFAIEEARAKILAAQAPLLDRLLTLLGEADSLGPASGREPAT